MTLGERERERGRGKRERWIVYIIECRDGSLYTGMTNDLPHRMAAHGAGKGGAYTRSRLPVRLVYTERRRSRGAALSREAAIKGMPRAAKLALAGHRR
jgi:predicted GIY-YIG superfamily endonuclease